jgi:hypothetical protein
VSENAQRATPVNFLGTSVAEVFDRDRGTNGTFSISIEGDRGIFEVCGSSVVAVAVVVVVVVVVFVKDVVVSNLSIHKKSDLISLKFATVFVKSKKTFFVLDRHF